MTKPIKADVQVDFGSATGNDSSYIIEEENKYIDASASYHIFLRLYHGGENPLVVVSDGTLTNLGEKSHAVVNEGIAFTGGDTVSTRYVPSSVTSMAQEGDFYDVNGHIISRPSPNFTYNTATNEIKANQKCYGLIKVTYDAAYRSLGYNYRRVQDIRIGVYYSTTWYNGTVLAFSPITKNVTSYTIPDKELRDADGDYDKIELWRVQSHTLATELGRFEVHANYYTSNKTQSFVPSSYAGYVVDVLRTHEIMYMDTRGRTTMEEVDIELFQPFTGFTLSRVIKNATLFKPSLERVYAKLDYKLPIDLLDAANRLQAQRKQDDIANNLP